MGNQTSNNQQSEYQRMGSGQQPIRGRGQQPLRGQQPQFNRAKSARTSAQQQLSVDKALDTLQSMFMLVDREVLRLVLMEQCQGNLENAVETLLVMQSPGVSQQPPSNKKAPQQQQQQQQQQQNEAILYDDNMRPITISDNFLQPPSHYLSKYYGLNAAQIANLQIQNEAPRRVQSAPSIHIDPSIVAQWTNLVKRYKFKDKETMNKICNMECKSLNRCGSLVRVIFMMKLYHRLCNESGQIMNATCGQLMNGYLSRGFKEYSLIQLINDCNHLMQCHSFGGDSLKSVVDEKKRGELLNEIRAYFGFCDVMKCRIIERILARQDNNDNKDVKDEIDVERDIVDKYHRVFFHPLN